ncbi:prolyl oligopeptidase family serine peptidase [Lysobacter sp. BMK333-48F3]|uniref:carboxylesterase family protein n=1 Tax=Lysobacter sp. BMK333-48F3 TaxID=2867962 RepID=UPI001C8CA621|nr:prolyl oligopeptidase family serine peptidase [Lysobacter sp. BMK333-48F3]MBX9401858.1 prolyl oligopeptidase family serine peptidase [Lysobacter sp. BMK333-48F3]
MRLLSAACLGLLSIAATACQTTAPATGGEFLPRELSLAGRTYRYQVFVPAPHRYQGRPAVVLFLNGSGERGDDGARQTQAGLGPYLRRHAAEFPAIVVFPQAPDDTEWTQDAGPIAMATLDAALGEFRGDPDRVYLTGMSMGGYGTWELALQHPQRFAALVPVCGGITVDWTDARPGMRAHSVADAADPFAAAAQRLREVPVWIFHGGKDDVVPPAQSRRMDAALKAAGARDARYTEFAAANHNSWDAAYAYAPMWRWLFAQRRGR